MKPINLVPVILGFVFSACASNTASTDVGSSGANSSRGTSRSQELRDNLRGGNNSGSASSVNGSGSRRIDGDDSASGGGTSPNGAKKKPTAMNIEASDSSVRGSAANASRDDRGISSQEGGSGKAPAASASGSRAVAGSWSGNDGAQKITVKFGANGSVILTNAAGANSGQWSSLSSGRFKVQIGSHSGEMVLLNTNTASLNMGSSTIELRR